MNSYALEGDYSSGRYSTSNYVYTYYNTITLISNIMLFYTYLDLPLLHNIRGTDHNIVRFGAITYFSINKRDE